MERILKRRTYKQHTKGWEIKEVNFLKMICMQEGQTCVWLDR